MLFQKGSQPLCFETGVFHAPTRKQAEKLTMCSEVETVGAMNLAELVALHWQVPAP